MFIELTLQTVGLKLFVNFDKVENFYSKGEGQNVWTTVYMENGRCYECSETPEEIYAQLAGGDA